jgi:hypothetical protein
MLSYASVLGQGLNFRASHVAQMCKTIGWSDNRVKLLVMLFARIHDLGKAVQVDPMKPKLKPPGTERLKL